MQKDELHGLYNEVVDQLKEHLHRGDTTAEAQAMHANFCSQIIEIVPQFDNVACFLKDVVIAFADKFQFHNDELLKKLALGTSAELLGVIRSAQAVSIASSAETAWKHVVLTDPESAVVIIALSYRLHAERKLEKLVRLEKVLEKQQRHQLQPQGGSI